MDGYNVKHNGGITETTIVDNISEDGTHDSNFAWNIDLYIEKCLRSHKTDRRIYCVCPFRRYEAPKLKKEYSIKFIPDIENSNPLRY